MFLFLTLLVNLGVITKGQKDSLLVGASGPWGPSGQAGPAGPQSCGITSFTNQGVVTSPGYPNVYYSFADCTYILTAGASGRVQLTFNDFNLEQNFDFLTIRSDGQSIASYTGSTKPPVLTLGSSVTLRFTTDVNVETKGFSISFTTIPANCGGLVVGTGLIQSPGYPGVYFANAQCVWSVVATQGQYVILDFQAFNMESSYDWVELYEGSTRVARYTGLSIPPRAILGQAGSVVFSTDSTIQSSGIRILANSAALTCGGLITGITTINSQNYPSNYVDNALCTWTYKATPSAVATRLTFNAFNMETNFDFLKIYDGENLRITYTGASLPKPIQLRSDTITVVFTTDSSIVANGFQLQFSPVF